MPATPTPRLGLLRPSGGDAADIPADVSALVVQLDQFILAADEGIRSSRAEPGTPLRIFRSTDTRTLWIDTGTEWDPIGPGPGDLKTTASGKTQRGWALCDGAIVSRTGLHADLFAEIGIAFGSGDGSTTFQLPDYRGAVPFGADLGSGRLTTNGARGNRGGAEKHTLSSSELAAHIHPNTVSETPHTHYAANFGSSSFQIPSGGSYAGAVGNTLYSQALSLSAATAGVSITNKPNTGGDGAHNNMPPYQVATWWIKL